MLALCRASALTKSSSREYVLSGILIDTRSDVRAPRVDAAYAVGVLHGCADNVVPW